jgi:hypothetical protein
MTLAILGMIALGLFADPATKNIPLDKVEISTCPGLEGGGILIKATGLLGSTGWGDAVLVPIESEAGRRDGILEFDLRASPPHFGAYAPAPERKVAIRLIQGEAMAKAKGVRVYGMGGKSITKVWQIDER